MTFSNRLPEAPPLTESSLRKAIDDYKRNVFDRPIAPHQTAPVPPWFWKQLRDLGWIDESGSYTEAFYRGQ